MKNIIVVGDSFCSAASGWPQILADELGLNLICHGAAGQPWWNARSFITKLKSEDVDNAEFIVFAHTNADRLPSSNQELGRVDHSKRPENEIETAIHLYYKYIHDHEFLAWAHQQWFVEISRVWGHKKLCHLHCFPWTLPFQHLLKGMNITTNLMSLSLNEINAKKFGAYHDNRPNHFNRHNNQQIGYQLSGLLQHWEEKAQPFDVSKFEQSTDFWLKYDGDWRHADNS